MQCPHYTPKNEDQEIELNSQKRSYLKSMESQTTKRVINALSRKTFSSMTTVKNNKSKSLLQLTKLSPMEQTQREANCDEKLLKLHGITKQLKIPLYRIKIQPMRPTSELTFEEERVRNVHRKKRPLNDLYKCSFPDCDYKNHFYYKLRNHMVKHSTARPFPCQSPGCSKAFKTSNDMQKHQKQIHSKEMKFACSFSGCSRRFRNPGNLKMHLFTHSEEKPYKCSICGWRTRQKYVVKKHMELHQENRKQFNCPTCDYASTNASKLKLHIRRIHTGIEKPFKCSQPLCNYASISNAKLKEHLRTHSKEKPYGCSFCDFKAHNQQQLTNHTRRHTGEKPYSCSQCDLKFATSSNLGTHLARHGAKNLECTFCTKSFFTRNELNTHIRYHTGEKPYSCTFCGRDFTTSGARDTHHKCCKKKGAGIVNKAQRSQY